MPSILAPPRSRNCYVWLGLLAGLLIVLLIYFHWHNALTRAQQAYLWSYAWNSLKVAAWPKADAFLANWYRVNVFHDPAADFIAWPLLASVFTVFVCVMAGAVADEYRIRSWRAGKQLRGPRLVSPSRFQRTMKGDGYPFRLQRTFLGCPTVRIKRQHEAQHLVAIGDPGAGKTTLFFNALDHAESCGYSAIVFDPHMEFVARYYNEQRGDVILNPLDARCPSWSPTAEIDFTNHAQATANARAQAASLYPGRMGERDWFWVDASRRIYQHLIVNYQPESAAELGTWMQHFNPQIDRRLLGDGELEQLVSLNAQQQRAGVVAHVTQPAFAMRQIDPNGKPWSIREWASHRKGWLFLTSTPDTREALRPMHSLWLDSAILRLLSMGNRPDLPPVLMGADEAQTLQRLPQLMSAMTEGRKRNLSIFLGFQGRSQIKTLYGEECEVIFSAPYTKFLLRTNEPEAGEWISKMIGDVEKQYLRESTSVSGGTTHRHRSYSTETKIERLVLASELADLPDREGYLRYGDMITRIKLATAPWRAPVPSFVPRESQPVEKISPPTIEEFEANRKAEIASLYGPAASPAAAPQPADQSTKQPKPFPRRKKATTTA